MVVFGEDRVASGCRAVSLGRHRLPASRVEVGRTLFEHRRALVRLRGAFVGRGHRRGHLSHVRIIASVEPPDVGRSPVHVDGRTAAEAILGP